MSIAICIVAASTGNLAVVESDNGNTLNGLTTGSLSIDGITPSVGDVILLKDQTDATQNGLFTVTVVGDGTTEFILQRWNVNDKSLEAGLLIFTKGGVSNSNIMFVAENSLIEVGITELNFLSVA